ncbi:hypothetical protein [Paenibacillus ginsengarvi]|uniref:hypothetical protein n=1 Tax=Paenibacillus ginsengarvi TaxID=400777 RepID=UPI001456AE65|nr:hypothetical protein [Paenibacillus ginsengarvi]
MKHFVVTLPLIDQEINQYRAETLEEAEELATHDPYVIHGARSCEIREWFIVERGREYE